MEAKFWIASFMFLWYHTYALYASFNVLQRTLTDIRDSIFYENNDYVNKQVKYTVRKLADGNIWMTENLALNYDQDRQFTSADTNVKTTKTAAHPTQALNGAVTPQEISTDCSDVESERICWYQGTETDITKQYYNRWLSRSTNNVKENTYSSVEDRTGENQSIGTYYNWYAATAGSGNWNTITNINVSASICPSNWQLPRATGSGSFTNLIVTTYGYAVGGRSVPGVLDTLAAMYVFPFTMPLSGLISYVDGTVSGNILYLWTAEGQKDAPNGTMTFALRANSQSVQARESHMKQYGFHVRCIVK